MGTIGLWASVEHKIGYKKNVVMTDQIGKELYDCAAMGEQLDLRMERIQRSVEPSPMDTKEERAK